MQVSLCDILAAPITELSTSLSGFVTLISASDDILDEYCKSLATLLYLHFSIPSAET